MDLHMQSCQQISGCWFCSPGRAGDYSLQKEQWIILGKTRACRWGGGGNATWEESGESKPLKIFPGRIPSNEGRGRCVCVGRRGKEGKDGLMQEILTKLITISDYLWEGLRRHCLWVTVAILISMCLWSTVTFKAALSLSQSTFSSLLVECMQKNLYCQWLQEE